MLEQDFSGALALVTGAGAGIGSAVVQGLVARGAQVAALDMNPSSLSALRETYGPKVQTYCVDVADQELVRSTVAFIEDEQGPIDLLVHAAGVLLSGSLITNELTPAAFRQLFSVNLEGAWFTMRAVGQRMMLRRRGSIVAISSNAGTTPRMDLGAYCASKAAVSMLTRCMALELATHGVRCNVVSPGSTHTPMLRALLNGRDSAELVAGNPGQFRLGIPLGRVAEAEDVADAVLFLLSAHARHITMHDLRVDGGATC